MKGAPIVLGLLVIGIIVGVVVWMNVPVYTPPPPGLSPEVIAANNRGVGFMGMFNYDDAHTAFTEALATNPDDPDLRVNLAIATLNRQNDGDEAAAMTMLEEVIADAPENLRAQYARGILLLNAGREDEAGDAFRLVHRADPDDAYALYQVAQATYRNREYEAAADLYRQVLELDPYLRSAYYGAAQALRRSGNAEAAVELEETFERLETNPRARTFKIYYTRMGPKAEAQTLGEVDATPAPMPTGDLFLEPEPVFSNGDAVTWATAGDAPVSITAADMDMDGDVDLFIAGAIVDHETAHNAVGINDGDGAFTLDLDHPLARFTDVNAAMWGDSNDDGRTDVYLLREGPNLLLQNNEDGWSDVTETTATANGELDSVDGLMLDADHDGDLDLFIVNQDGPNELLSNNSDGTFRPLAAAQGLTGGEGAAQAIAVDVDADRDVDLLVRHADGVTQYANELMWDYTEQDGPAIGGPFVAADLDADGRAELIELCGVNALCVYRDDESALDPEDETLPAYGQLAVADFNGDGRLDVLHTMGSSIAVKTGDDFEQTLFTTATMGMTGFAPVVLDAASGPSVVTAMDGEPPLIFRPGAGRSAFLTLIFAGRTDAGQSMRTNMSGIGTDIAVRADVHWTARTTLRESSGPGQSLQPIAIGLNGWPHLDFVQMTWSDGVFQSELHGVPSISGADPRQFVTGEAHEIIETQRQVSSCPVLFAWNGERFEFVSDVLGVGGIGFAVGPGEYVTPRPHERFLMPAGALALRDDETFEVRLGEPMEEACYLDHAELVAYDLPPGMDMTLDEYMQVKGAAPTGEAVCYDELILPAAAVNDRREDVTETVTDVDTVAAPVGAIDRRFLGRLERDHVLTLEFDTIPEADARLIIDGWVEYPYSQTMFAAWQAEATYRALTVEVRDRGGRWTTVLDQFGYPAGMPRQMSVGLGALPPGAQALRITTNQQVYFDRIAIATAKSCEEAHVHTMPVSRAAVAYCGYPKRTTFDQYRPYYDYNDRTPLSDNRALTGKHTRYGEYTPLVAAHDDAVAVFGPGEEIQLSFDAGGLPPLRDDWSRRYVLEVRGWCKDMDLYTHTGGRVDPLPRSDVAVDDGRRANLHAQFNDRFESGR